MAETITTAPSDVTTTARTARLAYLDNLKAGLIAAIIVSHAVNGYADYGSWAYRDLREVSLSDAGETVFVLAATIPGLFLMALFFLIAGLLTPRAIDRKGPGRFAKDRLLRLGLPLVVFTLLLWPATLWAVNTIVVGPRSFWTQLAEMDPVLDNGPLWFVGVLLLFSLVYAGWRWWHAETPRPNVGLGIRWLVTIGAGVAIASFIVRIWFPANSSQPLNVHLWEWPQCIATFAVGVVSARHGWLQPVSERLRRRCGWLTVAGVVAVPAMILSADGFGLTEDDFFGGIGIPSLLSVIAEAVLVICGSIWVLAFAQRHLDRTGPIRVAAARSSYAAFILQAPVLLFLAVAMRPVDLPAEVKALVVAALGVATSFALGWLLVTRTPVRRVL